MSRRERIDRYRRARTWLLAAAIPVTVFAATLFAYLLVREAAITSAYDQSSPFPFLNRFMEGRDQHPLDHYLAGADEIFAAHYFVLCTVIVLFAMLVLPRRYSLLKSHPLAFTVLTFLIYSAVFIYRTSFVVDGERYFCLFDDAMISMRYAKNLAAGNGLVWNPAGEPVEGYTNPLWVLFMSLLHLAPATPAKTALLVQVSAVVLLGLALVYVKRLAERYSGGDRDVAVASVFLVSFFFPLLNWSLQGMEVSLLALLVSVVVWGELRHLDGGPFSVWPSLLLGLSTLVRIDATVSFLALATFHLVTPHRHRVRALICHGLSVGFFLALQTLFRWLYYGELLPNTYYAKMAGYPILLRITQGLTVTVSALFHLGLIFVIVVAATFLLRRDRAVRLLALPVIFQLAYNVFVGGDAWEWWRGANRFLSPFMPLLFIVFADSMKKLLVNVSWRVRPGLLEKRTGTYLFGALIVLSVLQFNAVGERPSLREFFLLEKPLHVEGNEKMVRGAMRLREISAETATVAVTWAGSLPYFSDRPAIDLLGKNDKVIARQKVHVSWSPGMLTDFYPGHMKWDYDYSIRELRPDVVAGLWKGSEAIEEYLEKEYVRSGGMYLRSGSERLYWSKIPQPLSGGSRTTGSSR